MKKEESSFNTCKITGEGEGERLDCRPTPPPPAICTDTISRCCRSVGSAEPPAAAAAAAAGSVCLSAPLINLIHHFLIDQVNINNNTIATHITAMAIFLIEVLVLSGVLLPLELVCIPVLVLPEIRGKGALANVPNHTSFNKLP